MQGHCSTKEEGKPRQCPTPIMYQPYHPNPLQYWQHHTHTHTHLYACTLYLYGVRLCLPWWQYWWCEGPGTEWVLLVLWGQLLAWSVCPPQLWWSWVHWAAAPSPLHRCPGWRYTCPPQNTWEMESREGLNLIQLHVNVLYVSECVWLGITLGMCEISEPLCP